LLANATLAELASGFVAGTQVATQTGWCDVADVVTGDLVLTFDGGMQTVTSIDRKAFTTGGEFAPGDAWPLLVPAGALGNRDEMTLLSQQLVVIEADAAEEVFGDPFATVPALALEGYRGITRIPPEKEIVLVTLGFSQDEVVFANAGALVLCPKPVVNVEPSTYNALRFDIARALVAIMAMDSMGKVARQHVA